MKYQTEIEKGLTMIGYSLVDEDKVRRKVLAY